MDAEMLVADRLEEPAEHWDLSDPSETAIRVTEESAGAGRSSRLDDLRQLARRPSRLLAILNAQLRLRRAARLPISVRLRGRARATGRGELILGDRVRIYGTIVPVDLHAWPGGRIEIGARTSINYGVSISAHESVTVGRRCFIGPYCMIDDNDYHDVENKYVRPPSAPVVLEDGVWLGARVIVQKGVRIGHDSVVGAGSVVMRDIPPRSVAMGHPARVVRRF
jgi:maltose O-acetyltransferase